MLRTFTWHAAIALLPLLAIALLLRKRWLSVALAACALAFAWPKLSALTPSALPGQHAAVASRDESTSEDPHAANEIAILSMNVLVGNTDVERAWSYITQRDPDIILLQEFTPTWNRPLAPRLLERYPHAVRQMRDHAFGQAVFSKRPFLEPPIEYLPEDIRAQSTRRTGFVGLHDPQIRVVIEVAGVPITIQNVHTSSPGSLERFPEQRIQFGAFECLVRAESRPLVMAGDFNATENSRHIRTLLSAGLHDAHALAGSGLGHTWPDIGIFRYVPGIRIDHVLASPEWTVLESEVGPNIGSDRRPRFVRIALTNAR
jgi:endonuclease/exonuclease/phosphatase (EEP) superfamily protein YafD